MMKANMNAVADVLVELSWPLIVALWRAIVVWQLRNTACIDVFHVQRITFTQAFCLYALSYTLFASHKVELKPKETK